MTETSTIEPRETLYVHNLNEKISINNLKQSLEKLFAPFGKVLQITAHKNLKMKGQAFISFNSVEEATAALKALDNTMLFQKQIKIEYSKTNSDMFYIQSSDNIDEIPEIKQRKELKKLRQEATKNDKETNDKKRIRSDNDSTNKKDDLAFNQKTKKTKLQDWKSVPPNNILLIQDLPDTVTQEELINYFKHEEGYINLRFVKIRHLAFIEFDSESIATRILESYQTKISNDFSENTILTYAKK